MARFGDYDENGFSEPWRNPGPSKAEMNRQLRAALLNTGAAPAEKRPEPAKAPKPAPVLMRPEPHPIDPADRSDIKPPFEAEKSTQQAPKARAKALMAEFKVCERCGGPRSIFSAHVCRKCYTAQRAEGPPSKQPPPDLMMVNCLDFTPIKDVRIVRALEALLRQTPA